MAVQLACKLGAIRMRIHSENIDNIALHGIINTACLKFALTLEEVMELSDPIPTACLAGCIVLVFIHFFYLLDETIGSRPANATIGTAWMFNLAGIGFWMLGARNDEPVNQRVLFFLVLGFVFLSIVSFIEVRLVLKRRREIIEPLTVPVIPRPYVLPERRWKNGKPEYAAYVMGMLQQLVKVQPLPEGRRLQDPSFGVIGSSWITPNALFRTTNIGARLRPGFPARTGNDR